MTAEIAILNKTAVALAADSAVTIQIRDDRGNMREKVYRTDKVFTLSKYAPVGVMVYADAQFLGTPWPTIIKMYREHLGQRRFQTLDDYANHFIEYVGSFAQDGDQRTFFTQFLTSVLEQWVVPEIDRAVEQATAKQDDGKVDRDEIASLVEQVVGDCISQLREREDIQGMRRMDVRSLAEMYAREIQESTTRTFKELPLSHRARSELVQLATLIFSKDVLWRHPEFGPMLASGIVVSGFGESDIYPCMCDFMFQGVAMGRVRVVGRSATQACNSTNAVIKAFAQSEAVNTFVEGVDPGYQRLIDGWLNATFAQDYPARLREHLEAEGLAPDQVRRILENVRADGQMMVSEFDNAKRKYSHDRLISPMLVAVSVLSKDELAEVAESMVNLTSIRRRISLDTETVGGPIDVAVISKGDGFVWIRRKHYFDSELNHHFFRNYFNSSQDIIDPNLDRL